MYSSHIYVPFSHGQSICYLVSSYLDMLLHLDDRGMLLSLGACEQLLSDGLKEILMLVVYVLLDFAGVR